VSDIPITGEEHRCLRAISASATPLFLA
jgi:hypothetical protein